MVHVLLLVVCAVAIYLSCEWFVNAIEWLGVRMKVGGVAVGTILAAAGTALPESVVTLMAVLFGSEKNGNDIAVGAAMGGPLVVGTLAYAVTGAMLFLRFRKKRAMALAEPIEEPVFHIQRLDLPDLQLAERASDRLGCVGAAGGEVCEQVAGVPDPV